MHCTVSGLVLVVSTQGIADTRHCALLVLLLLVQLELLGLQRFLKWPALRVLMHHGAHVRETLALCHGDRVLPSVLTMPRAIAKSVIDYEEQSGDILYAIKINERTLMSSGFAPTSSKSWVMSFRFCSSARCSGVVPLICWCWCCCEQVQASISCWFAIKVVRSVETRQPTSPFGRSRRRWRRRAGFSGACCFLCLLRRERSSAATSGHPQSNSKTGSIMRTASR